jgi:hypothetical protein
MKPRQQAILHTVARWAYIYRYKHVHGTCDLCKVANDECGDCPYVEAFQRTCTTDFPGLANYYDAVMFRRKEKLRRACELAAQYGLKRQAALIVRRILRG